MRVSIKQKMMIAFLVLSIIPITIFGFFSYQIAEEILLQKLKDESLTTVENANKFFIKQFINSLENAVNVFSNEPALKKVIFTPNSIEEPLNEWSAYLKLNTDIWYIYMGTEKGDMYMSPSWKPPTGYDPRIRPWYQEAIAQKDKIVWTKPYVDLVSNRQVVSVVKAIISEDNLIGVFAIDTSLYQISNIIREIKLGANGYAMLLDEQGYVIAHPNTEDIGTHMGNAAWFKRLKGHSKGTMYFDRLGHDLFISYTTVPRTGWKLVAFIPRTALQSDISPIKERALNVGITSLLIAILISIFISNGLASKINRLIHAMTEVENNNLKIRISYNPTDEIEFHKLSDKFNNMVYTLGQLSEERNQKERNLKYLSRHDSLTGLFNRAYFENKMHRLIEELRFPIGIVVCDIDGLKLINDTMGHSAGDKMLITASIVIKRSFREKDTMCRIGGDEFAIIMPNTDEQGVELAIQRLKTIVKNHNLKNPKLPISISTGFSIGYNRSKKVSALFKEADNNMYREKLHQRLSARSAIVQTLMKALEARDFITEGHADRLQDLVIDLGLEAGLNEHRISDMRLLAQFHDIGKVGIPDRILFKPGPLDESEVIEMQRHCEIGFRIAQSSPDLVPIADWVLKHHESWNGDGYPLGLKGKQIPIECRILAIADSYDAMTNDRPYRKGISPDQATFELKRCAGIQFDPELVKKFIKILEARDLINIL